MPAARSFDASCGSASPDQCCANDDFTKLVEDASTAIEEKVRAFVVELLAFVDEHQGRIVVRALTERRGPREIAADGTRGQGVRRLATAIVGEEGTTKRRRWLSR
jgi:hypothetical protein